MHNTWYSIARSLRRTVDALSLFAVAALILASQLVMAATPDWVKQVAHAPLPTYGDDIEAVMLLDERTTTVSANGEVKTTYRKAYKILRPTGRSRGTVSVYFDSDTQLTFLKAWSITSQNEEYEVKEKDAIETSVFADALYSDTRVKLLQIPASAPGSVIAYEYEQRDRSSVLQDLWIFQAEVPVRQARFVLELPPSWDYTATWRNHAVVSPQQVGNNRWRWEVLDVEAIKHEAKMPAWRSVAGQLRISFRPKSDARPQSSADAWAEVGRWYAELSRKRREVTPEIRTTTRALLTGADSPMEKIRRLAFYVQHTIRYVAIEIGIGGYQPHAAGDVLASGYGDCKDKATLLSAMLREAGFDSYYLLMNTDRDYVDEQFSSILDFNHVVLAIALPKQAGRSNEVAVSHSRLGELLLFDPTDISTPFGYLPASLQFNHGLLVTDEGAELVKVPLSQPSVNRITRFAKLNVDQSGDLTGTVEEMRTGPAAASFRDRLLNLPKAKRQKAFQDLLSSLVDGAVLTSAGVSDLTDASGSLSLTYGLVARGYAQNAGRLFLFRRCVLGSKGSDVLEEESRKHALVFSHARSEGDVVDITYPATYEVDEAPQLVRYEYPFATYKSEAQVANHVLHYTRNFELREVRVPLDQLGELKTFFRQIAEDERAFMILKSVPARAPAEQ